MSSLLIPWWGIWVAAFSGGFFPRYLGVAFVFFFSRVLIILVYQVSDEKFGSAVRLSPYPPHFKLQDLL